MAEGMNHLDEAGFICREISGDGVLILATHADYDQYCYTVAGTVGHLATELVILQNGLNAAVAKSLLDTCEACGRGLQKTNIIKDFTEDLERGFCYIPDEWLREVDYTPMKLQGATPAWSWKVLENTLSELTFATEYTLGLPYLVTDYRLASLLCLLPAYQTIFLAARHHTDLFTTGHPRKISPETFQQCIQDAQDGRRQRRDQAVFRGNESRCHQPVYFLVMWSEILKFLVVRLCRSSSLKIA